MAKKITKKLVKSTNARTGKNIKTITVKNADGEPDTTAKILVQNKISYTPKVSVIIPVYNVEKYLRECLDSVVNQTLREIEIICVDDGSTDSSLDILKEYASKDNRITVIAQQNLHAGVARNAGLAVARGEYLSFLDSDDFFELNMLEKLVDNITAFNSDIALCKCSLYKEDTKEISEKELDFSLNLNLLPSDGYFIPKKLAGRLFSVCQGFPWDKLFRKSFIEKNGRKFQNLMNTNDAYFSFTSLAMAEKVSFMKDRLIFKRHKHGTSLSDGRNKHPDCFVYAIDAIEKDLKRYKIYDLYKNSFWEWALSLCLIQLKTLSDDAKKYLFGILHNKFNSEWECIDNSNIASGRSKGLRYIKANKEFPTINIAYSTNKKFLNLCLVSIASVLKNSTYENINVILLHTELTDEDIQKINELNTIRKFNLITYHVDNNQFKDYPLVWTTQETWYRCILPKEFTDMDKILYLDVDTVVRKSLLDLWSIDLGKNLIAAVEDVSNSLDNSEHLKLKQKFYFNAGVLLLNAKEWRKQKLFEKITNYVKTNEVFQADQGTLNVITDGAKVKLMPEYNYMNVWWRTNTSQYTGKYKEAYEKCDPTIVHYTGTKPNNAKCENIYKNDFYMYASLISNYEKLFPSDVVRQIDKYNPQATRKNNELIVSLTSYPARIGTINQTIESLLNQTKKADKIILWLAPEQFPNREQDLPKKLLDLCNQGLTIDWYHDIRSYKKLNPTLQKYPDAIIVTADDDNIYQSTWLEKLYNSYKKYPHNIHAHRVTKFYHDQYGWHIIAGGKEYYSDASYLNKVVGLGGVLYPPNCFYKDILNEDLIFRLAPTNDDQWYWLQAAMNGFAVRVVEMPEIDAHYIPGSQATGLTNINDHGQKLFWKDFNRLLKYYPQAKKLLLDESKKHPVTREFIVPYKKDLERWHENVLGKKLNLDNPQTFNEKMQWLKLYDSTPEKTLLADKYLVRDWVAKTIGEEYLIPLLGAYDSFDEIDFDKLPNQFVMKCNHGSGWNIVVKDKRKLDMTDTKSKLDRWMSDNYAFKCGLELHYRDIPPKIVIEKFMSEIGNALYDYRFFCFDGRVEQIWLDIGSGTPEHKRKIYDRNWNEQNIIVKWPRLETDVPKPKNLKKMISLAEKMSKGFAMVRVDFYDVNDKIYFGEMTFTSMSGTGVFEPASADLELGKLIKLPKLAYNIDTGEYYEPPKQSEKTQTKQISKMRCKPYSLLPYYLCANLFMRIARLPMLKFQKHTKSVLYSHSHRGKTDMLNKKFNKVMQSVNSVKNDITNQILQIKNQQNNLIKQINEISVNQQNAINAQIATLSQQIDKLKSETGVLSENIVGQISDLVSATDTTSKNLTQQIADIASETKNMSLLSSKEYSDVKSDVLANRQEIVKNTNDVIKALAANADETKANIVSALDTNKKDIINNNIEQNNVLYFNPTAIATLSELGMCDMTSAPNFEERFKKLISGLPAESAETVVKIIRKLQQIKGAKSKLDIFTTTEQEQLRKLRDLSKEILKVSDNLYAYKNYMLPINHFEASVFVYNHGISQLNSVDTFKDKDILDVGGFIGDSVLMLAPLTTGKVHIFEATNENYNHMLKTIELNGIKNAVPVHTAVGDKPGEIELRFNGSASSQNDIMVKNPKYVEKCPVITIDDYVREHNLNVGLIKVDIEGAEQSFLRGAYETIRTQKPTLLISIYHNVDDFLDIKPMIESWNLGYKFKIFKPTIESVIGETLLICEQ